MDKQLIIELLQLMGEKTVDFKDLQYQRNPHSHPKTLYWVCLDDGNVLVKVDDEVIEFQYMTPDEQSTLLQRLRLMYNEKTSV
ncbi:MAG: NUDIX hydrolase [Chitinophagaceae bacterium]|nr:NUDIX hydrolase [Chitinophagaceae bacterium]